MQQLKAFKFFIQPTPEQEILFNKTFGCSRFVWNKLTENFNSWSPTNKPEKITEKTLKDQEEFEFLREVSAATLQQKRIDFENTKKQFFNKKRKVKLGRMKFKSRKGRQSFRLPNQKFNFDQETSTIKLEKIGVITAVLDRIIPEDAIFRSVTISRDPSGKYYASVLVSVEIPVKPLTGRMIGIDLGLKDLFILSDGQVVNNPRWFRENQSKLKRAQQHFSRKKISSKRWNKQRIKVAKMHEDIRNQRNNYIQEISTALVTQFDVICIEDLNVKGMVKNPKLAKSISDASWSSFTRMLEYKCNWYGKSLIKIDRFYPSSKTCSECENKLDTLELDVRNWECPNCKTVHNRDLNAAKNILRKGYSDLTGIPEEFGSFPKLSSVESIEYNRGEAVSPLLFSNKHHLASSVKRLVVL